MYAGCVLWPFHFSTWVGIVAAGAILVIGGIQTVVKLVRSPARS